MKVIIALDSFKGSLSASQVAKFMARAVHDEISTAKVIQIPMAGGKELLMRWWLR